MYDFRLLRHTLLLLDCFCLCFFKVRKVLSIDDALGPLFTRVLLCTLAPCLALQAASQAIEIYLSISIYIFLCFLASFLFQFCFVLFVLGVSLKCLAGLQGGPHNHTIAALATALKQAKSSEFVAYQKQV